MVKVRVRARVRVSVAGTCRRAPTPHVPPPSYRQLGTGLGLGLGLDVRGRAVHSNCRMWCCRGGRGSGARCCASRQRQRLLECLPGRYLEGARKMPGRCHEGAREAPARDSGACADTRGAGQEAAPLELGGAGAGRCWSWTVVVGARTSHSTSGGTLPRGTPCSSGDAAIVLASTVTVSTMPKCVKPAESSASSPKRSRKMAHSGSTAPG
eukprot:scaffold108872_cov54-Phaeocystis_antarctica.AAC.2